MSTSGLSSGTTAADVTGSAISVVDITFGCSAPSPQPRSTRTCSLSVKQMVNAFSIAFATDVTGQVNDQRGGPRTRPPSLSRPLTTWAFGRTRRGMSQNEAPLSGVSTSAAWWSWRFTTGGVGDAVDVVDGFICPASMSDANVACVWRRRRCCKRAAHAGRRASTWSSRTGRRWEQGGGGADEVLSDQRVFSRVVSAGRHHGGSDDSLALVLSAASTGTVKKLCSAPTQRPPARAPKIPEPKRERTFSSPAAAAAATTTSSSSTSRAWSRLPPPIRRWRTWWRA